MSFGILRAKRGSQIKQAAKTERRIEKTSGREIQRVDGQFGIDRREGAVCLINGTRSAIHLEIAAARETSSESDGKFGGERNIRGGYVHLVIVAALLGCS